MDIFHIQCMRRYVNKSEYTPSCPNCRHAVDSWLKTWEVSEEWTHNFFDSDDEAYSPANVELRKTTTRVLRNRIVFAT